MDVYTGQQPLTKTSPAKPVEDTSSKRNNLQFDFYAKPTKSTTQSELYVDDEDSHDRIASVQKQGFNMSDISEPKMSYEEIYQRLKGYNIT